MSLTFQAGRRGELVGVSLAKVVHSASWAHLSPAARNLFAYMAITVKDHDSPPRYFGGRDNLVMSMDGELRAPGPAREHQYRRVRRALEQIIQAGGIVPLSAAHHGRRAEYELRVMAFTKEGKNSPPMLDAKEGKNSPPEEGSDSPPFEPKGGQKQPALGGQKQPAQGTTVEQLKKEDLPRGGIEPVLAQPHLGARASESNKPERCAECGRPERQCRARAARHGQHEYRPVEFAPLRLA